jgi:hypothetical protein
MGVVGIALAAAVVAACAPTAPPDTPELRMERARALAELELGAEGAYQETLGLGASLATDATTDALIVELGRELSEDEASSVHGVMRSAIARVLTPERWMSAAAEIYAAHFSVAELDQAMMFYSSPVGAKIMSLQGTLDNEMGSAVEAIIDAELESVIGAVDRGLEELFPELAGEAGP